MLYLVTSLSHITYYIVWRHTNNYIKFCKYIKCNPHKLLYKFSIIQKIFQFYFIYKYSQENNRLYNYFSNLNYSTILKLFIIIFGQSLNVAVYNKLGFSGVYYGNKLGLKTIWVYTYPYNIFSNPQYLGCVLTLCGMYGIIDLPYILYSSLLYYITITIESTDYIN